MKRKIRRGIEAVLTIIGIILVFGSVLFAQGTGVYIQFMIVLVGVMVMEIGVWGLSSRLIPSERKYLRLRSEGDRMIELIRELNNAALARDRGEEGTKQFQATLAEMHESVVRMSELAARKEIKSEE